MLRDATHEPLIKRTVMLQLDHEGVVHLHKKEWSTCTKRSWPDSSRATRLASLAQRRRARPAGWKPRSPSASVRAKWLPSREPPAPPIIDRQASGLCPSSYPGAPYDLPNSGENGRGSSPSDGAHRTASSLPNVRRSVHVRELPEVR
jgi:hypothetical protein